MRRISDYTEFLRPLLQSSALTTHFESKPSFEEIMKIPRLVIILNHATPLSWIPAVSLLALEAEAAGGGDRIPRGIADKWFYNNPFTQKLAEYLTQANKPQTFEELIADFKNNERSDIVLMPEGAHSFFGNVFEVEKFRSSKFIEIAIRAKAPILIAAHKGSESWSLPLQLPTEWAQYVMPFSKFFGERLMKAEAFNLPLIPQKIRKFSMSCELYWPELKEEELSPVWDLRKQQLRAEGAKIKAQMNQMIKDLI